MCLKRKTNQPIILCFLVLIFLFPQIGKGQCALVCTSTQVSLDDFCQATITPDMILEGYDSTCVGPLIVEIFDLTGTLIPTSPTVTVAYLDKFLIGQVTDTNTGNSCWDSIYIEDKFPPEIICPTDTLIFSMEPPIPMRTGEPTASDACGLVITSYTDISMPFPNMTSDTQTVITRTWFAEDQSGNIDSCEQIIYLKKPDLLMVQFPPHLDNIMAVSYTHLTLPTICSV